MSAANVTIARNLGVVDGRSCVVLKLSAAPQYLLTYWVDPSRDFVLLRMSESYAGKTIITLEVSYDPHPEVGWVPAGWKLVFVRGKDGSYTDTLLGRVSDYAINEHVDSKEFEFQFPVRTWVTDLDSDEEYMVRAGGEKRAIPKEEIMRGAKYQDIVKTDTGKAAVRKGTGIGVYVSILIGLGLVIAVWIGSRTLQRRHP